MDVPSSQEERLEGPIEPEDADGYENGPVFSGEVLLQRFIMLCYAMLCNAMQCCAVLLYTVNCCVLLPA